MSFWVHWSQQIEARNVLWECLQLSYQEETTLEGTETSTETEQNRLKIKYSTT